MKPPTSLKGPYKFLDYYEGSEANIFFGRNLETELLLSDIISTRLVLLFARTGSGKTSLINAGVRPRLKKLNYETFYIRVEQDPTESARVTLRNEHLLTPALENLPLDAQLEEIVRKLGKPIVLFFDQFEEFFIFILNESRSTFISEIARLYRNRDSGVHIVFSFREEFFVEMEAFRTEIPSIFHNESNLRLRWFTATQALEAIVKPAEVFGTEIDGELADKIVEDLLDATRGVEPARLQIVCDTLWRNKTSNRIGLPDYDKLGGAQRIVEGRLEQDIAAHLDEEQLRLLEKLLPVLRTRIGIKMEPLALQGHVFEQMLRPFKHGRTVEELMRILEVDESTLRSLIQRLKDLNIVKEVKRYDDVYVEWISDYLADLTDFLQKQVRTILLRRLITRSLDTANRKKAELKEKREAKRVTSDTHWQLSLSDEDLDALYMTSRDFDEVSRGAELLSTLSTEEAFFLFEASLEHGKHMKLWFDKAEVIDSQYLWSAIKQKVTDENERLEQAESAVKLLGEVEAPKALRYLKIAMQQDSLSLNAVRILADKKTTESLAVLGEGLADHRVANQIIDSLASTKSAAAIELIGSALDKEETAIHAELALERIGKSKSHPSATAALKMLDRWRGGSHPVATESERSVSEATSTASKWSERDWTILTRRIMDGRCIPVIGPLASGFSLSTLSHQLAEKYRYPFDDPWNFSLVADFVNVEEDRDYLESLIREAVKLARPSEQAEKTFEVLAGLPLPVYVTTTYDDFLYQALEKANRQPVRKICRWHRALVAEDSAFDLDVTPTAANPVVYHLHGSLAVSESLVLSASDHLQWLQNVSRDQDIIPSYIQRAFGTSSNLFMGLPFRELSSQAPLTFITNLLRHTTRTHIAVMTSPTNSGEAQAESIRYIESYFERNQIRTYWATAFEFATALLKRYHSE